MLADAIRAAGVVGAGGAGFPTHVKAASQVEFVVANGAECEPLLHKDGELLVAHPDAVVVGVELMMEATGAQRGIIGLKAKKVAAVEALTAATRDSAVELQPLGNFYPTGDEYVLVYETTGRLIPPQGIPLAVGTVVNNVETLYNIARAHDGIPVTDKFLTVAGAVKRPTTMVVPLGTSFGDLIRAAGGVTEEPYGIFVGGVMMGHLTRDLSSVVTKTTTGLIVLPESHRLVERMLRPERAMMRIGKSACDQCSYCTEFCPRYLLGYDVQPHKVMRSLGFTTSGEDYWNRFAQLCCECGLCTLYACPEELYPKEACLKGKRSWREQGLKWEGKAPQHPHPMQDGRRVPLPHLVKRLELTRFDQPAPFRAGPLEPAEVRIPLRQHVGAPSVPVVQAGQRVQKGQLIAQIPDGQLGANIHASITGTVLAVTDGIHIRA